MEKFKNLKNIVMTLILFLSITGFGLSWYKFFGYSYAISGDSDWVNDFEYTKSDDKITLKKYTGSSQNVIVPGTAVIDGITYHTIIEN